MKTFKHNDKATINGRRVYFGTVSGYAEQYAEAPRAAIARAREHGHELHWVGLEPIVIYGNRNRYALETAAWADAPALAVNDIVTVLDSEGAHELQIVNAPNRNFRLVTPVIAEECEHGYTHSCRACDPDGRG